MKQIVSYLLWGFVAWVIFTATLYVWVWSLHK